LKILVIYISIFKYKNLKENIKFFVSLVSSLTCKFYISVLEIYFDRVRKLRRYISLNDGCVQHHTIFRGKNCQFHFTKSYGLTKKPRVVKKNKKKPSLSRRGRLPRAGEKKTQKRRQHSVTLGYGKNCSPCHREPYLFLELKEKRKKKEKKGKKNGHKKETEKQRQRRH
jgi:hypothetical protein